MWGPVVVVGWGFVVVVAPERSVPLVLAGSRSGCFCPLWAGNGTVSEERPTVARDKSPSAPSGTKRCTCLNNYQMQIFIRT